MKKVSVKKTAAFLLLLSLVLGMAAGCAPSSQADPPPSGASSTAPVTPQSPFAGGTGVSFKPAHFQVGHPNAQTVDDQYQTFGEYFKTYVGDASNGAITLDILGNAQLGAESEMAEGMKMGSIDMAIYTNLTLAQFMPEFSVFDLPFTYPNIDVVNEVLALDVVDGLHEKLYNDYDIKILAVGAGGFRHTMNMVRPIHKASDLHGIKMRTPPNTLQLDTFNALGANATVMAWSEVFTALEQKTVEGVEAAIFSLNSSRFQDVCKYLSMTSHMYVPIYLSCSRSAWEKFSPEQQKILLECAQKAADDQSQFVLNEEERLIGEMVDAGVELVRDVDYQSFRDGVSDLLAKYRPIIGEELFDTVQAVIDANVKQ